MAGSAFVFVIVVLNFMLYARCDLHDSHEGEILDTVNNETISGNVSIHRQLGLAVDNRQSTIAAYATLQTILKNSRSDKKVRRCTHYVVAGIETKPTCASVVMALNITVIAPAGPASLTTKHQTKNKSQLHFPSNFKRYDLTRPAQGCLESSHKFITKIYLPWQVIKIFSDKAFDEADVEAMHDVLYESAYTVTKIFNISRPTFLNFVEKIAPTKTMFIIDDQPSFQKAVGKPADKMCWLYGHSHFFINKDAKCGSHLKLLSVLYTLYMNDGYLMKGGYGPYWWKLGLCYYAAGFCYENEFKGKDGLRTMFHKQEKQQVSQVEEYVYGSILHGFLDSTPELRKYHVRILNILNENPRSYQNDEYSKVVEEIINLFGDTFNKKYYCKLYDTYELS